MNQAGNKALTSLDPMGAARRPAAWHVDVRYFASLREALGASERIAVEGTLTVGALRDLLIARGGAHAETLGRHRAVRTALDLTLCDERAALHDGAEVGFFPPVTGG